MQMFLCRVLYIYVFLRRTEEVPKRNKTGDAVPHTNAIEVVVKARLLFLKALFHQLQAIDIFMSSCTVFVFLSLIEYAFVNVMMGDISEVERKDKTSHLRNIIVASNTNLGYSWQPPHQPQPKHPSQTQFQGIKVNILQYKLKSRLRLSESSLPMAFHNGFLLS